MTTPPEALGPKLDSLLREQFGLPSFRPGQREAIETLLDTGRLICIQPTGHGKSLLYQLPALLFDGMTLVVSPLLALMRDQVQQLGERFSISAGAINSDQTPEENDAIASAAAQGKLKILFVAPERLDHLATYEFLVGLPIDLFVVDEAHCISTWGHDFRPSYRQIMNAVHELESRRPELKVLGLTATANARTEEDIVAQFQPPTGAPALEAAIQRQSMDRPNLALRVIPTDGLDDKLVRLEALFDELSGTDGTEPSCGILYCATREQTEIVAGYLTGTGRNVVAYHAGLAPDHKRDLQEAFTTGRQPVIAATNALGMGIDKSDLRFVIHVDLPGSITAYYQEVGRAGRDGEPAVGVLLFEERDREVQEYFINSAQPSVEDFARVLEAIPVTSASSPPPPGRNDVGVRTGLHPTKVTVILAELVEQRYLIKEMAGRKQVYARADRQGTPDLSRYARQQQVRTDELEAMLAYGRASECCMQTLRVALGDETAEPCGRCGVCTPDAHPIAPVEESARAAARRWVVHRDIPIPASKIPKMDAGIALLDGQVRSPLFVRFMQQRAEADLLESELDEMLASVVERLAESTSFTAVVAVPSRTWRAREAIVTSVAARLGVPAMLDLLEWDVEPDQRQGELLNNDQRRDNVKGKLGTRPHHLAPTSGLLLIDDYIGSGATLKEAVRALRKTARFAGPIVPLTVAKVRWRIGSRGMI